MNLLAFALAALMSLVLAATVIAAVVSLLAVGLENLLHERYDGGP